MLISKKIDQVASGQQQTAIIVEQLPLPPFQVTYTSLIDNVNVTTIFPWGKSSNNSRYHS